MGLGKTFVGLRTPPLLAGITVVVSVIGKSVWAEECLRWTPRRQPTILTRRGSFRWARPGELVITGYELLPDRNIPECPPGQVLILDEGHRVSNPKAARSQRARMLADLVRAACGRVWVFTGSPWRDRLSDVHNLLEITGRAGEFAGRFGAFARALGGELVELPPHQRRWGAPGRVWRFNAAPTEPALRVLGAGLMRRLKSDVGKIPPKVYHEIKVPLPPDAPTTLLDWALDDLRATLDATEQADLPAEDLLLRALTHGERHIAGALTWLGDLKRSAALKEIAELERRGDPFVVYAAHRGVIKELGARAGWGSIIGGDDVHDRPKVCQRFAAGELRAVAATIGAGGEAVSFSSARTILFIDRAWLLSANVQAENRADRLNRVDPRPVEVIDLVAEHDLDRRLHRTLASKRRSAERLEAALARYRRLTPPGP